MKFEPPLLSGILVRRYKRFLADIVTDKGEPLTLHCPNTGSMKNCCTPGHRVWYSDSGNPKRKYPYTWELVEVEAGAIAGINTHRANALVKEALESHAIPGLSNYSNIQTEVRYGAEKSRIDFLLSNGDEQCFMEVKSVTLGEGPIGYFPDAVTTRGQKHLRELMSMVAAGHKAVLFFCVQHTGVEQVQPADQIDPEYGRLLREAVAAGVQVMAWQWQLDAGFATIKRPLPLVF